MSFSINSITGSLSSSAYTSQMKSKLQQLGVPDDVISQGLDSIQEYAEENGITLPSAKKEESGSVFGDKNTNSKPSESQMTQQLVSLGIPASVISQGQSAVKKYASENNITLPEPPQGAKNSAGGTLDLIG